MPALEVADIFRRHGESYRRAHADHLSRTERRVMGAIEACRTAALGGHVERCAECGLVRISYNSCRDRHCPKCQGSARAAWVAARQTELLPVPYFHVVFTLPAAAAEIAFQNKAVACAILFKAAAETLSTIAADPNRSDVSKLETTLTSLSGLDTRDYRYGHLTT
jgi:Transposase zinc-binding domain